MSQRLAFLAPVLLALACRATAGDDFATAMDKGAGLDRYTFQVEEKPGKGAGTGVEATYQKGQPVYFKADQTAFYKSGDVLIYKQGDAWKRSKRGIESDPLTVLVSMAKVNAARLPHEEIAALG